MGMTIGSFSDFELRDVAAKATTPVITPYSPALPLLLPTVNGSPILAFSFPLFCLCGFLVSPGPSIKIELRHYTLEEAFLSSQRSLLPFAASAVLGPCF